MVFCNLGASNNRTRALDQQLIGEQSRIQPLVTRDHGFLHLSDPNSTAFHKQPFESQVSYGCCKLQLITPQQPM